MGIFDSLKKILDTAEDLLGTDTPDVKKTVNAEEDLLLVSADAPAKPSAMRKTIFFGGDEGDDEFDVSFRLSGDFIEFNSHCEWDPAYQYEPDGDGEYTEYKDGCPQIFIGPFDAAFTAAQNYKENGTQSGMDFEPINSGTFLFKAMFECAGDPLYAYVFADGTTQESNVLGLTYSKKYIGTKLERKLKAALDEAAATYTETKKDE